MPPWISAVRVRIVLTPHDYHPSDDFFRIHARSLRHLRQLHPDRTERDLAYALAQANGLTEAAGHVNVIGAAVLLLEGMPPRGCVGTRTCADP